MESRFDPVTIKGNLFTDTLTINSHKINNIQSIKAFTIDDGSQPDMNGSSIAVDNTILIFCC